MIEMEQTRQTDVTNELAKLTSNFRQYVERAHGVIGSDLGRLDELNEVVDQNVEKVSSANTEASTQLRASTQSIRQMLVMLVMVFAVFFCTFVFIRIT